MNPTSPVHTDIVLLGGGHSHVAVLKAFGMRPLPGVRLTLVARDVLTPYSGMLPGLLAGHYRHSEAHVDLQRLCRFAGARLYHASADGLDLHRRRVHCGERPPVAFDWLSIDVGSTPRAASIAGADRHALAVKPVDEFLAAWSSVERRCAERGGDLDIAVIGAGAGGVELTLSLEHRLRHALSAHPPEGGGGPRFHLVSETADILPTHAPAVRGALRRMLETRAVALYAPARAVAVDASTVELADGRRLPADVSVVVTEAAAPAWLAGSGLSLDADGFVRVGPTLRVLGGAPVFAAGDVASLEGASLPKSGVYAVRQGPVLARNLRAAALDRPLRRYRPQRRTLALVSTGDRAAVASYGSLCLTGRWVWTVKDRIDRRWMRKYQELPRMEEPAPPPAPGAGAGVEEASAFAMRCGGCGSKVASPVLRRVLAEIGSRPHPGVLVGLERPDDAAVIEVPAGRLLVQSVDHFRTFIDDPYLFARITANHCLSDLFAMGATPHTAQVLASLPFAHEAKIEQDLLALLLGVEETLSAAGAALVGGHTAEGPELSLGLAVNGLVRPDAVLTKGGMRAGDRLVLTKPLGTGVVFAADMRAGAGAEVVDEALRSMLQSNQAAAECLIAHHARGCTDVTGFGLAGHLVEMLRASALDAVLDLPRIPLLPGARELLDDGVRSSLHAGNEVFLEAIEAPEASPSALAALVDPQTSGGLVASLPASDAAPCVEALHALGYAGACIIGRVELPASDRPLAPGRIRLS